MTAPQVVSVIGVDPGPTTGLCFLDYIDRRLAAHTSIQVNGDCAQLVLEAVLAKYYGHPNVIKRAAGVENFITGQSAGTKGDGAEVTRQLVMKFTEQLQMWGYHTKIRKKADVWTKNGGWATDRRLKAAGILGPPEMRHANDAARHALFTAKDQLYMEDPLR